MPKQNRWRIKRKIDEAAECIERAQLHLVEVAQPFENVHPEIFSKFTILVQALEVLNKTAKQLGGSI